MILNDGRPMLSYICTHGITRVRTCAALYMPGLAHVVCPGWWAPGLLERPPQPPIARICGGYFGSINKPIGPGISSHLQCLWHAGSSCTSGLRGPSALQEWHKTSTCHSCGEVGHLAPPCPNKDKTNGKTGDGVSPVPVSSAQIKELTSPVERKGRNASYIATVCRATPSLLEQQD